MASEPKRPDDQDQDNVVSLREARARQAAQARKLNGAGPGGINRGTTGAAQRKMPVLLIFLGLLAIVVAFKFLVG